MSRHKGCRLLVIEPVLCGSNSILKVRFLGHLVYIEIVHFQTWVFVYAVRSLRGIPPSPPTGNIMFKIMTWDKSIKWKHVMIHFHWACSLRKHLIEGKKVKRNGAKLLQQCNEWIVAHMMTTGVVFAPSATLACPPLLQQWRCLNIPENLP